MRSENEKAEMRKWLEGVIAVWEQKWKHFPHYGHRYKRDLAAFIGEFFLNEFDLRDLEIKARAGQSASESAKR